MLDGGGIGVSGGPDETADPQLRKHVLSKRELTDRRHAGCELACTEKCSQRDSEATQWSPGGHARQAKNLLFVIGEL